MIRVYLPSCPRSCFFVLVLVLVRVLTLCICVGGGGGAGGSACLRRWEEALPPYEGLLRAPPAGAEQASAALPARATGEGRVHRCTPSSKLGELLSVATATPSVYVFRILEVYDECLGTFV